MAEPVWVALLRGINVGGRNRLPMADLRALVEDGGGGEVATYIQSGNVVFRAADPAPVVAHVEAALAARFGGLAPVVLRSAESLRSVVDRCPFDDADRDARYVHVGFLGRAPAAPVAASLDPARSPGDSFVVDGAQVYLRCPNGLARTKLSNTWFESRLDTVCTVRNWRTVERLVAMCAAPGA